MNLNGQQQHSISQESLVLIDKMNSRHQTQKTKTFVFINLTAKGSSFACCTRISDFRVIESSVSRLDRVRFHGFSIIIFSHFNLDNRIKFMRIHEIIHSFF